MMIIALAIIDEFLPLMQEKERKFCTAINGTAYEIIGLIMTHR